MAVKICKLKTSESFVFFLEHRRTIFFFGTATIKVKQILIDFLKKFQVIQINFFFF